MGAIVCYLVRYAVNTNILQKDLSQRRRGVEALVVRKSLFEVLS